MRFFKYIILSIVTFFTFNLIALAAPFSITVNMEATITDNTLSIVVGFKDEEVQAISHYISYDAEMLSLIDVVSLENFTVTKSNEVEDGKYRTLKILADTDGSFYDTNYAVIIFELKDKFAVKESTHVFFYGYEAVGSDMVLMRNSGVDINLRRDTSSTMLYTSANIDNFTRIRIWLEENLLKLVIGVVVFIGVIIIIVNLPSPKKGISREKKIAHQIKSGAAKDNEYITPVKVNLANVDKMLDKEEPKEEKVINPFVHNATLNTPKTDTIKEEKADVKEDDIFIELPDDEKKSDDGLAVINPITFEDSNKSTKDDDDKIEFLSLVMLLILGMLCLSSPVIADSESLERIRDCVVGNIPYESSLDVNSDGSVDVIDVVYEKNA